MKRPRYMRPFWSGWKRGIVYFCTSEETVVYHLWNLAQCIMYPITYTVFYLWFNLNGDDNGQV